MTQIEPYRPVQHQLPEPPSMFELGGHRYMLVPQEQQPAVSVPAPSMPAGPRINGVLHTWTPQGYQPYQAPYHAHPAHPPWLRNHYSRGTGFLVAAGAIGLVLACVAIAFYAVIIAVMAHALAIGLTLVMVLVGVLILMGGVTKMRHGHGPNHRY